MKICSTVFSLYYASGRTEGPILKGFSQVCEGSQLLSPLFASFPFCQIATSGLKNCYRRNPLHNKMFGRHIYEKKQSYPVALVALSESRLIDVSTLKSMMGCRQRRSSQTSLNTLKSRLSAVTFVIAAVSHSYIFN